MTLTMDTDWGVEATDPNYGKPTGQAERAKEIKELYTWWTVTYPNRPDPHEASGWSEYCDRLREERGDHWFGMQSKTPETEDMGKRALKLCTEIEEAYDKENNRRDFYGQSHLATL
jgi:hypothetical protein